MRAGVLSIVPAVAPGRSASRTKLAPAISHASEQRSRTAFQLAQSIAIQNPSSRESIDRTRCLPALGDFDTGDWQESDKKLSDEDIQFTASLDRSVIRRCRRDALVLATRRECRDRIR